MTGTALSTTQLLAFVTDRASADAVRALLAERGLDGRVEQGDAATAAAYLGTHPSPQLLVVEVPSAEAAPALLDALADVVHPACKVIVTGAIDTLSFYQWLLSLGIHDYLLAPFTPQQLQAAMEKGGKPATDIGATPAVKKLIGVIGARGGVGTSTIATNLAALFARDQHLPTGLVDLDPHFGSVALGLDLEPGRGLRDALEKPDRVDGLFLDRVMIRPFSGLAILSAEEPLHEAITIQPNAGEMLFAALAEKYALLVADLPRQMNPLTRYVLAHADRVVLVAEPHLIDVRDALRLKDYVVEQLKRPAPLLVLNRTGLSPKQELPARDIAKHYGAAPVAELKFLPEAYDAATNGELLVDQPKLQPFLSPLRALAVELSGVEPDTAEAGGSLPAKLFKGR